jgi:hypothetical protein
MTKRKLKKKFDYAKIMLPVAVFNISWFSVVAIILQFVCQVELSSTLILCWYGFWTTEVALLAGIKMNKVKNKYYDTAGVPKNDKETE